MEEANKLNVNKLSFSDVTVNFTKSRAKRVPKIIVKLNKVGENGDQLFMLKILKKNIKTKNLYVKNNEVILNRV